MIRILRTILASSTCTDPKPRLDADALEEAGIAVRRTLDAHFRGSLAIRQVDAGSCNGCELEINALENPYHDLERFGVRFVASPRHADALLVTGPVSRHMAEALRRTWEAMAEPRLVITAGDCACNGGVFGTSYASLGGVDQVIPVDVSIPGCPPTPQRLLLGILAAMGQHHQE
jgi:Ni,Fe-hydrogenase III small subunit